jgi:three-Cys-motif partner protein
MKNSPFKLCYIDAFAGSGRVEVRGHGEIAGSALRALERSFDRYIFIEKKKEYTEQLEALKTKYPEILIDIKMGDSNGILKSLSTEPWYENYWRGIVFLDPYAMNLKWESLRLSPRHKRLIYGTCFPCRPCFEC